MQKPVTEGIHHLGLTVSKLQESADFFINLLGWKEVKRKDDYPAIFVSDGTVLLTLWAATDEPVSGFNKNRNVGLHHVAFSVRDEKTLHDIFAKLSNAGVPIEFGPEPLGPGPAKHLMCYEPSGARIELVWPGAQDL